MSRPLCVSERADLMLKSHQLGMQISSTFGSTLDLSRARLFFGRVSWLWRNAQNEVRTNLGTLDAHSLALILDSSSLGNYWGGRIYFRPRRDLRIGSIQARRSKSRFRPCFKIHWLSIRTFGKYPLLQSVQKISG